MTAAKLRATVTVPVWLAVLMLLCWAALLVGVLVAVTTSGPAGKTQSEINQCEMEKALAGRSLYEAEMLCE